jgi:drug/metabolite transporter (DMT)-like permease
MRITRAHADLSLAFVALIWGSTFVIVKDALNDVSTLLFLTLRFTAASVALAFVFRRRLFEPAGRNLALEIRAGLLAGSALFAGYVLQTMGLRLIPAAQSGFITGLYVVFTPLLVALVYRRAPHASETLGVLVATAGMWLLTMPGLSFRPGPGDLLTVGCAAAFALHLVILAHYGTRINYASLSLGQVAVAAMLGWLTFWWAEVPAVKWSGRVWFALAVTSLFATALAFTLYSWAQRHTTATRTALVSALEPVFAWLTSFVVLGEVLSARAALGAALILAGILLVELKPIGAASQTS